MSTITVTGTLISPLSLPLYPATIRATALDSANDTPECAEDLHYTTETGAYSFELNYGRHLIEVNSKDEYCEITEVIVDEDTPNPISLTDLARYSKPVTPPVLVPDDPDWEQLYYQLRSNVETLVRTSVEQLRDGEAYVSDTKQILQNSLIGSIITEEVQSVSTNNADLVTTKNTYADDNNHESVIDKVDLTTRNALANYTTELNEASNGNVQYLRQYEFAGQNDSIYQRTFYDNNLIANRYTFNVGNNTFESTQDISETEANDSSYIAYDFGDTTIGSFRDHSINSDFDGLGNPEVVLSDKITLDYSTFPASIDNYQRLYLTPTENILGEMKRGINVYGQDMYDLYENDGLGNARRTTRANVVSYEGMDGVELVEMDTDSNTMTVRGRLIVENSEDFKGDPGAIFYFEYQYATTNSTNEADWHDIYDSINDRWRRQREVTGTVENPQYGAWSDGFLLNAQDGADGDPLYVEYRYNSSDLPDTDPTWHEEMQTGDIWRIERIVQNGVPITVWSEPARIRGFDGNDAYVTEFEYQYAIYATDPDPLWHFNFTSGDHYRRERLVVYASQADYDANNPILPLPPWNNVAQIAPINGVDYGALTSTIYIYKRGTSVGDVGLPSGTLTYNFDNLTLTPAGNLNGWSQEIPDTGTGDIYIAVATVAAAGYGESTPTDDIGASEWDVSQWSADAMIPSTIFLYKESENAPSLNFTSATRDIYTGAVTIVPPGSGWSAAPTISEAAGAKLWYITDVNLVDSSATTSFHPVGEFSAPALFGQNGSDGVDGVDGIDGVKGDTGNGSWIYLDATASEATVRAFPDSTHTGYFTTIAGKAPEEGDVFSYISAASLGPTNQYRVDFIFKSGTWESFINVVNGNQIVHGTIVAETIQAATFTGDEFNAAARIIVGSGANTAGLNGLDTSIYNDWRIWSGSSTPASANFRVDSAGNMTALSGDIGNARINGTWIDIEQRTTTGVSSGYRVVPTHGQDGVVGLGTTNSSMKGSLSGKVAIWAGGTSAVTGNFQVSDTGDVYANNLVATNGSFSGELTGSSFNGIRLKIGSFPSTVDGNQTINISTYEGRVYNPNTGSFTSHGNSAAFTQLVGVSLSHMGPATTTTADMNFPQINGTNSFIFNRDDQYNGTEYFSFMAWGV